MIILSLLDMIFHCMDAANQIVMNVMEKELYIVLNSKKHFKKVLLLSSLQAPLNVPFFM